MPTYDYICRNCRHKLEVFENYNSRTTKCPSCKFTNTLERQIGTGGGVIFKGAGFYCNDYKKGG
jgi:putative FmdB family regulatory protein